jgi:hypothetical protein
MKKYLFGSLVIGLCWLPVGNAADGFAIEAGQGNDTDMGRISLMRSWDKKWFTDGNWHLTGYWEVSLGHWKSANLGAKGIWDVGLTPVFRLRQKEMGGVQPYAEAAVGVHLISRTQVDNIRQMGSAFQFGDHAGIGMMFGDRGQFDLGYRFQHLSNVGIKDPNDGINFHQIRFGYLF